MTISIGLADAGPMRSRKLDALNAAHLLRRHMGRGRDPRQSFGLYRWDCSSSAGRAKTAWMLAERTAGWRGNP